MFEKRSPEQLPLGHLLAQVCRLASGRVRAHMEKIGLHRGQGFVLMHLWRRDGVAQREIACAMQISPATMTNMLQRMEQAGWILRERDSGDQRIVRVHLTDKAKSLQAEAEETFREIEEEFASIYTEEERATLKRLLLKLHGRFAPHDPHRRPCSSTDSDERGET